MGRVSECLAGVEGWSGPGRRGRPDPIRSYSRPARLLDRRPICAGKRVLKPSAAGREARARRQQRAKTELGSDDPKHILFGDMHVHSTYSTDAFRWTLPMMKGARGAFPPADACDYARYISQLDFYWITDHAEAYTPQHWKDSVDAIRQCNAVAGDPHNPDTVAFVGWEWTQMEATAKDHYGHHNVFFRDIEPDKIPARPIAAAGLAIMALRNNFGRLPPAVQTSDRANRSYYQAFERFVEEMGGVPNCEPGTNTRQLPLDCLEIAADPGVSCSASLKSGALIRLSSPTAAPGASISRPVRAGIIS